MSSTTLLYIGTDQGLVTLRSEDEGVSWDRQSLSLTDWEIPRVAVLADQPNRVVAGTRGDGVWVSEDYGNTWTKPSRGIPGGPGKVQCVVIDPNDPNTIWAGAEPIDLFVTHDGGVRWTKNESVWDDPRVATVFNPGALVEPYLRNIVLDPDEPDNIYATLHVGYILRSTNRGEAWELIDNGYDHDVHSMLIDPQNTNRIFLASGGDGSRRGTAPGRALYMSEDSGDSWTPVGMDFHQDYGNTLVMHPRDPQILFSAMATGNPGKWRGRPTGADSVVVRSLDGGKNWHRLGSALEETSDRFAESIVIDSENPDNVYVGFRTGEIYASHDGGDAWSQLDLEIPQDLTNMRCVRA